LCELAFLHEHEVTKETLDGLREVDFPENLGLRIEGNKGRQVVQFMHSAVQDIGDVDDENSEVIHELAADFAAIYLNHTYRASPCESVWFDEDGLAYQAPMFQIREIYRGYGLVADNWRRRSEDHLVLQLLFISHLMGIQTRATLHDASKFLDEHLLRWIGNFAQRVASRCFTRYYGGLSLLTDAYLDQLRDCLANILDEPRPSAEEIEQRLAVRSDQRAPSDTPCGPLCIPRDGGGQMPDRRRYP
jgi:TorA maturation chaperone TorD